MLQLSDRQLVQLEKHILAGKETAKLIMMQMCLDHCRNTDWYVPVVPQLTVVDYEGTPYDFVSYKLNGFVCTDKSCVILQPKDSTTYTTRITLFKPKEVTHVYKQLLTNFQKHCKELWSLYEKTWKLESARIRSKK